MRRTAQIVLLALLTGGVGALTAVAGSVAFVRARSAGHCYSETDVPSAPVALVLGAQVQPDGTPSPYLAARLELGRRLLESGRVRVLLLTGDAGAPEHDEPAAMRAYLVAAGVPAERLVTDAHGYDTYDSCVRARRVFGVDRVVVVSQSYHLPRAVATARSVGLDAVGVGDTSVRRASRAWIQGLMRDQVACVKTVIDLVTSRQPVLGGLETASR
ncbi:vancomycin high temperature exclusion protein [uncultured Friedmanniella sp.]|uniref:SanA/YdcF family protein n=1 Tax=uncultured Friedmanniella sp. TaxID=335381 RepID=UPI0035C9E544